MHLEMVPLTGPPVRLDDGSRRLILFWDRKCPYCAAMGPELRAWTKSRREDSGPKLIIVVRSRDAVAEFARAPVVLDEHQEWAGRFGVVGTPAAVLVGADGRVESEIAHGRDAIFGVLGRTVGDQGSPRPRLSRPARSPL